jgi:hypothetical protein
MIIPNMALELLVFYQSNHPLFLTDVSSSSPRPGVTRPPSSLSLRRAAPGVVMKKRRRSKHERATMKIKNKIDQTRGYRRVSHAVHRREKNP